MVSVSDFQDRWTWIWFQYGKARIDLQEREDGHEVERYYMKGSWQGATDYNFMSPTPPPNVKSYERAERLKQWLFQDWDILSFNVGGVPSKGSKYEELTANRSEWRTEVDLP